MVMAKLLLCVCTPGKPVYMNSESSLWGQLGTARACVQLSFQDLRQPEERGGDRTPCGSLPGSALPAQPCSPSLAVREKFLADHKRVEGKNKLI